MAGRPRRAGDAGRGDPEHLTRSGVPFGVPLRPLVCLIVEDQAPVAQALDVLFALHDVPTRVVADAESALQAVREGDVGVVIQDMNFAPGETSGEQGAALFRAIREIDPGMPVLLMTAFTSLERAVSLVKAL